MSKKPYTQTENDLAEKCRLSLEKKWGCPIPMPKQCGKK
jgi:hypothetical protein